MAEAIALILLCGALDRARGWRWGPLFAALNGYALAALVGFGASWWAAAFVVWFVIGAAPGWGAPLGAVLRDEPMKGSDLEWWQKGPLALNAEFALFARGLFWFGPPMAVAFPVSAQVARFIPGDTWLQWRASEFIRGALNALFLWAGWFLAAAL